MLKNSNIIKPFLNKWSLIILAVGCLLTVLAVVQTNNLNTQRIKTAAESFSNQVTSEISRRFELYQYGLRGARGAILTAGRYGINRSIFQNYSATRDVDAEFPGALGFGFIRRVPVEEVNSFLAAARFDDWADFEIRELSPNTGERYVIQYIEPVARNIQAVGLDIASESNRRNAARSALLSGEVRLSGPITLVQATGQPLQSFLILMPIYATVVVPETEEARSQYGFGWSYAPLITSEVLADLEIDPEFYHVELTDVTAPAASEIFYTNNVDSSDVVFSQLENTTVYGRNWQVNVGLRDAYVSSLNQLNSLTVGILGLAMTLLTSGFVGTNAASRASRAAVVEEQAKLAAIVSSSADAIIGLTVEGHITAWNAGAAKMFGLESAAVVGRPYLNCIVPERLKKEEQVVLSRSIRGEAVISRETVRQHRDGREIAVSISQSPIFDEQNKILGISKTIRDISQQKKTEQEIKSLNANLEAEVLVRTAEAVHVRDQLVMASEAAELGIWVWDCITNDLQWNDKMFEMYDYPPSLREEGIEYSHWFNRIHPDDQEDANKSLQKALTNEETWNSTFRLIHENGQVVHINARALVEFDDHGTALTVTGVNRDITAEVELEQSLRLAKQKADEANTAKSNFLSNMSHELRTPMNAVLGMLTLVKNTELTARQSDYITKSEVAARSLLNVLNDILDYSKIDAGKMQLDAHTFEIDPLLQELSTILAGVKYSGKVEVLFDLDPNIPQQLTGDRMRLLQVLINLTNNALKFTEQGHVVVRLTSVSCSDTEINVLVAVEDTGIGISNEQQERLFVGFTQAEASTARRFGGTGLGLVISQSLVELMGGKLQISSELGKGSRFYFELPFGLDKEDTPQSKNYPQFQSCRVLLCDDNETSRQIIKSTLSIFCSSVETVSSGYEALSIVLEQDQAGHPFDIVFMDWRMPGMDGLQAAQAIMSSRSLTKQPKIIMVTAYGAKELERVVNANEKPVFADYLIKPATPLQFKSVLSKLIEGDVFDGPALEKPTQSSRQLQGAKILLVEDNDFNRQIAFELLGIEGAEVTLAEGGLVGVDHVLRGQVSFDAVLMDMQMPDIDGLEATRRIRADSRFSELPIIAMTANVSAQDIQDCLDAGMNDHIGKPVDIVSMVGTIKQYLPVELAEVLAPNSVGSNELPSTKASARGEVAVDIASVVERLGGNTVLLRTLLESFERNADKLFEELDQQWRKNDMSAMLMTLHSLKGSSANVGATNVAALASDWEAELKQQIASSVDIRHAVVLEQEHIKQLKQLCTSEIAQLLTALDAL